MVNHKLPPLKVALPYDAEPFERELRIHEVERSDVRREHGAQASRRNDPYVCPQLLSNAPDKLLDQSDVAVDEAGLHRVDRVGADRTRRSAQTDAGQLGGAR